MQRIKDRDLSKSKKKAETKKREASPKKKLLNDKGLFLRQPSEMNPVLSKDMDKIIKKATAYKPEDRYPTCSEYVKDLQWYQRRVL